MSRKKTALRASIDATFLNGIADVIIKSLTSGPLLTTYVFCFGMGNAILGFLQSVIPWSNLFHLPVSYFLEKNYSAKKIACLSSLFSRPFLFLAALAFLIPDKTTGFLLFSISYCLFFSITGITAGAFWPWCKMLVPHTVMTGFFAHRIKYILLAKIITIGATTLIISSVSKNYQETYIYFVFFMTAFAVGCFYTYTLFKMKDVNLKASTDIPFIKKFSLCLSNKPFISFFCRIGFCNFTLAFFTPFSFSFLLKELNLPISLSFCFSLASTLIDILFVDFWKKYTYKKGISNMLSLSSLCFCLAILPLFLLSVKSKIIPYFLLSISFIFIGMGNSGMNFGISDSVISFSPKENSSIYISLLNVGRFFFCGLGSFSAGITLDILSLWTIQNYACFFILCFILFYTSNILAKSIRPFSSAPPL